MGWTCSAGLQPNGPDIARQSPWAVAWVKRKHQAIRVVRGVALESGVLAPGLQGARYLKKIENHIFVFKKNVKKIVGVDHDILHGCEKFQPEIFCIPPYTKMTNFWIWDVNSSQFKKFQICLFCVGQNTKYFGLKIFTAMQYVIVNM